MADFYIAHKLTAQNEGGYSNDQDDAGGETYKGWARKKNPQWDGWPIIDGYKGRKDFPKCLDSDTELQKKVYAGYVRNYWNPIKGDQINLQSVANQIYDNAVNFGVVHALKIRQEAAGFPKTGVMNQALLNHLNSLV